MFVVVPLYTSYNTVVLHNTTQHAVKTGETYYGSVVWKISSYQVLNSKRVNQSTAAGILLVVLLLSTLSHEVRSTKVLLQHAL